MSYPLLESYAAGTLDSDRPTVLLLVIMLIAFSLDHYLLQW